MSKKIVVKFYNNDTIKEIKCKNCVYNNAILAGNKLIAKAKTLPKKPRISVFNRFITALKYCFSKADINRKQYKYAK